MPLQVALSDSSAVFAITANVPTQQFNRSPFQEINKHFQADFVNIVRPVVKRSYQPTRVDMLAKTAAALPVGRVGAADDIAQQILTFMTVGFATGSIVYIDGGALVV